MMNAKSNTTLLAALAMPFATLFAASIEFPFGETGLVIGREATAKLAAEELNDIVKRSAGQGFAEGDEAKRRIFIGHSAAAEAIIGTNVFNRLLNEESVVFSKGNDLFLIGGGDLGPLWAVYDFCEDSLGYRWYLDRSDGERIVRTDVVRFNGTVTRRKPKFSGYRTSYLPVSRERTFSWRFRLRNRDTKAVERFCPNYRHPYRGQIPGHGFGFFLPPFELSPAIRGCLPKGARIVENNFKCHPEWFSLMQDGTRNPDHQLCLSNPECRKALTAGVLEWIRCKGKGYYQVGENDARCGRYCHCKGCAELEKKYNTTGGPLWDYLVELCTEVKRLYPDGVYITSLAYDGLDQTEKAPDGISRFPDNFDVNIAYIQCPDRALKDIPDKRSPEGEMVNFYRNTCKWVSLTSHSSYWFYGTESPFLVYRRMQKELQELHEAGVESVGSCRTGGGYEFGDFTAYLYRRLVYDPWCDIRHELEEVCEFKYGKASALMLRYIDSLEKAFEDYRKTTSAAVFDAENAYRNMYFLSGKDIAAWRKIFEEAEPLVRGSPFHAENLRYAKIGLDLFTVLFEKRVREEAPECVFDRAAVEAEGIAYAREYENRHCDAEQRGRNPVVGTLERASKEMAYYGNLKDASLPEEFNGYQKSFVTCILPYKSEPFRKSRSVLTSVPDPDTPCGFAIRDVLTGKVDFSKGLPFYIWNWSGRTQLLPTRIPYSNFRKGAYTTFRIGVTELAPDNSFIFAETWDTPLASRYLNRCYNVSSPKRKYEIWITAKGEGPAFFPDEKGQNVLSIAAIYVAEVVGS